MGAEIDRTCVLISIDKRYIIYTHIFLSHLSIPLQLFLSYSISVSLRGPFRDTWYFSLKLRSIAKFYTTVINTNRPSRPLMDSVHMYLLTR